MARRSLCKKAISPETIVNSDGEEFMVAASDNQYVVLWFFLSIRLTMDVVVEHPSAPQDQGKTFPDSSHGEKNTKRAGKYGPFVPFIRKDSTPSPVVKTEEDDL